MAEALECRLTEAGRASKFSYKTKLLYVFNHQSHFGIKMNLSLNQTSSDSSSLGLHLTREQTEQVPAFRNADKTGVTISQIKEEAQTYSRLQPIFH